MFKSPLHRLWKSGSKSVTLLCAAPTLFSGKQRAKLPFLPPIFGHEAAGIVESVGEGVSDMKEGDRVLPVFTRECGECRSEESNMCDLLRINTDRGVVIRDGKSRFSIRGHPIYHFLGTSTISEYTVVHVGCVAKINPAASLDKTCVLSCGVSTGPAAPPGFARCCSKGEQPCLLLLEERKKRRHLPISSHE